MEGQQWFPVDSEDAPEELRRYFERLKKIAVKIIAFHETAFGKDAPRRSFPDILVFDDEVFTKYITGLGIDPKKCSALYRTNSNTVFMTSSLIKKIDCDLILAEELLHGLTTEMIQSTDNKKEFTIKGGFAVVKTSTTVDIEYKRNGQTDPENMRVGWCKDVTETTSTAVNEVTSPSQEISYTERATAILRDQIINGIEKYHHLYIHLYQHLYQGNLTEEIKKEIDEKWMQLLRKNMGW